MITATFTDIQNEIREFFDRHLMVNSFIASQTYDFQAKDNIYSAVVFVPTISTIQGRQLNLGFDIYFVDRITEDGSNTRDVYNDELQIANDFITYFSNRNGKWNLQPDSITLEPFEQKFDDILAGWRLSVSVQLPFYKNVCDIPLDDDRPEPPVPPVPPIPPTPYKKDHAQLKNLDYEHAGHIGFQPTLSEVNAGDGISITTDENENVIISNTISHPQWGSIDGTLSEQTDLQNALNEKQNTLTAGDGISIENNVISTDIDLTGYANIDASNFTDSGTTLLSGLGMPSNRYETPTVGASGSTYTAPANGWFYIYIMSNAGSAYQTIYMENIGKCCTSNTSPANVNALACTLPFQEGDVLRLYWSKVSSSTMTFRFYYTEGNPTPPQP